MKFTKKKIPTKFFSLRKVKAYRKPFRARTSGFEEFEDGGIEPVDLGGVVFFEITHFEAQRHEIVLGPAVEREVRLFEEPYRRITSVELMGRIPDDGKTRFADHLIHPRFDLFGVGQESRLTAACFHPVVDPFEGL